MSAWSKLAMPSSTQSSIMEASLSAVSVAGWPSERHAPQTMAERSSPVAVRDARGTATASPGLGEILDQHRHVLDVAAGRDAGDGLVGDVGRSIGAVADAGS